GIREKSKDERLKVRGERDEYLLGEYTS
ncbi:MAG: hypothetical protein H6Q42_3637, partial [Deltaproteobacteria bacterium]|nr:hypothetical protein [Deltaproteobacteria bacterium]